MLSDELRVTEVRIFSADAVNFCHLARRQIFVRIETPAAHEQALSSQDLVEARNAACEIVARIKECCICVSHFSRACEQREGAVAVIAPTGFDLFQQFDRAPCPHRPVTEQPSGKPNLHLSIRARQAEFSQQIGHDDEKQSS